METCEWYEQFNAQRLNEALQKDKESGQLETMVQFCGMRLGRPLTEAESTALADRLNRLRKPKISAGSRG